MQQEQDDTLEVLKWIAAQPWSDGQVGMFGISWGGFQAIQTAYRRPKELKALCNNRARRVLFQTDPYDPGES